MAGDKNKLTEKQRQILEYLKQEILQRGFPPSVREICEAVSLRSTSSVHAHLETLERKGYIKRDATKPRAIEICDEGFHTGRLGAIQGIASEDTASQSEVAQIPLIGKVAAGEPILAVENIEGYFPIKTFFDLFLNFIIKCILYLLIYFCCFFIRKCYTR